MSKALVSLYPWALLQNPMLGLQSWLSAIQIKERAYDSWTPTDWFDQSYTLYLGLYLHDSGRKGGKQKVGGNHHIFMLTSIANQCSFSCFHSSLCRTLEVILSVTCKAPEMEGEGQGEQVRETQPTHQYVKEPEAGPDVPPGDSVIQEWLTTKAAAFCFCKRGQRGERHKCSGAWTWQFVKTHCFFTQYK